MGNNTWLIFGFSLAMVFGIICLLIQLGPYTGLVWLTLRDLWTRKYPKRRGK